MEAKAAKIKVRLPSMQHRSPDPWYVQARVAALHERMAKKHAGAKPNRDPADTAAPSPATPVKGAAASPRVPEVRSDAQAEAAQVATSFERKAAMMRAMVARAEATPPPAGLPARCCLPPFDPL